MTAKEILTSVIHHALENMAGPHFKTIDIAATAAQAVIDFAIPPAGGVSEQRRRALVTYLNKLSPNLLRSYLEDHLDDAPEAEIDKLVIALHAGHAVPAKEA